MRTFTPSGREQTQAYHVARYLWKRYTEWTADPLKPGDKIRIPYLHWIDGFEGQRDAYWLLCDLHRIPREA